MFSGPQIKPAIVEDIASQEDIAPSIIGYLGLKASNHFLGINLLEKSPKFKDRGPIFSFKYGDMAMRQDSTAYYITPVNSQEPAIAQKIPLTPSWDTSNPSDGFITGAPFQLPREKRTEIARKMRAAAKSWEYIIYKNRLMPNQ